MRLDRPLVVLQRLSPALILALLTALVNALNEFGFTQITDKQLNSINLLATAVMAILTAVGILSATNNVTPVSDPQLPAGTTVKVTDAANVPTHTETLGS